jgi:hypothetical protein
LIPHVVQAIFCWQRLGNCQFAFHYSPRWNFGEHVWLDAILIVSLFGQLRLGSFC